MTARASPPRSIRTAPAIVALGLAIALITACIGTSPTGQSIRGEAPRRAPNAEFLPSTVNATNGFAVDLYRSASGRPGNAVYGTYSIALSLGMVRAGSAGSTLEQFDVVLHANETVNLDEGLNTLEQTLAPRSGDKRSTTRRGRVSSSQAASVWGQRGTRFKAGYLDLLAADYDAPVRVVDFRSDAESARDAINQWGAEATQGRINEVVPRGDVTAFTRFLPVAVSYLRAPWQIPFDATETRPGSFVRLDGETVEVQTMQVRAPEGILTAGTDDWKAVEIPYLGGELSLLVVVPRPGTFAAFEQSLDTSLLDEIVDELEDESVDLRIPQFQFTTSTDLTEVLRGMGLTDAFSAEADFSGITSDEVLNLSGVAYQGYFGIDEEGTDAESTATVPATEVAAPGAERVTVDRPFVFAVRDRQSGLILLIGRVISPI